VGRTRSAGRAALNGKFRSLIGPVAENAFLCLVRTSETAGAIEEESDCRSSIPRRPLSQLF